MQTYIRKNGETRYVVDTGGGYTFGTPEEALAWEATAREFHAVSTALPAGPLTRVAYEAACAEWQSPALSDAELRGMSYALKYGEFEPPQYGRDTWIKMGLARARWSGLNAERAAAPRPAPRQPAYPAGRQLDCGCIVYEATEVMSASAGTSCQDCYDRMSN